jgi:hypothetical protein
MQLPHAQPRGTLGHRDTRRGLGDGDSARYGGDDLEGERVKHGGGDRVGGEATVEEEGPEDAQGGAGREGKGSAASSLLAAAAARRRRCYVLASSDKETRTTSLAAAAPNGRV